MKIHAASGALLAAALFLGNASVSAAENLPAKKTSDDAVAYQISGAHAGEISFAAGFTAPLRQAWVQNFDGAVSYPLIAHGMAFVTVENSGYGNSGTQMYALNLATGAVIWEKLIPSDSNWSNAAYDQGEVFIVNGYGDVEASDAKTGKLKWTAQLPSADSYAAPVAGQGLLFIGSSGYPDTLYALNESTGATQWTASLSGYSTVSAPAVGAGAVYVSDGEYTYAISASTGSALWTSTDCDSGNAGLTPVYYAKLVYVRTSCGGIVLDASSGDQAGYFSATPAPAFFQKKRAVSLVGSTLYDYDLKSGNVVWSYSGVNGDGGLVTAPIVANGLVIEASSDGNVYLLDGETGELESTMNVGAQIPSPNEGDTYDGPLTGLAAGEGTLVIPAYDQLSAYVPQQAR